MESKFYLLVLNGPLKGQTLELPSAGEVSFGEEGDYWAHLDAGIQHVALKTDADGVRMSHWVPCWVQGTALAESPAPLPLNLPIDFSGLGGVILATDNPPDSIRSIILPRRSALAGGTGDREKSSYDFSFWVIGGLTLMLVCAGLIGLAYWYYQQHLPEIVTYDLPAIQRFLADKQTQVEFQHIAFSLQANGEILLTGRCANSQQLNELVVALKAEHYTVRSRVVCDDQLVDNVTYITQLYGFNDLRIQPGKELGTVKISGPVKADANWKQVVDLMGKLSGLKSWNVENLVNAQMDKLVSKLQALNLENLLNVYQQEDKIFLTGVLSADQETQLKNLLTSLEQEFEHAHFIYQNIESVTDQEVILPAPIASIGGSLKHPFIELSNGTRLQVGSKLPSGYQITSISVEHGIRLKKQEKSIQLPLEI